MIRNKKGPSALQHQQQRAQTTLQDILLPSTRDSIQQNTEHTRDSYHNSFSDQQQSPLPTALTTTLPVSRFVLPPVSQYGNTTQYHNRYQSTLREHTIENTGLTMVLERMRRCFWDRISNHHIDMLSMCLSNIFISVDELYRILLPELTTCLQRNPTHSEKPITEQEISAHYCIWSLLQDIENALEHLEPLCHLLINTIMTTVEALDRSCSIYGAARIKRQLLREGEDEESTEILAAISTAQISDHTYYHWMQAVRSLSEQLQQWQYCNQTRCSFAQQFDLFATMIPTLGQVDSMLDLIVDTMQAIFGQILPEFHMIARGDDETATTLLLDVTQKIDLILLTIHTQIEPLYILTREYAHKIKLQ
jgi:hypothetical protein